MIKHGEQICGQKYLILVIDDTQCILDVTHDFCKIMGHETVCALSGEEGLVLFKKAIQEHKPFDIVIVDLHIDMGMNGVEILAELLKIDEKVKAILMSGYSDGIDDQKHLNLGFKKILPKPFHPQDLSNTISEVLRN